MNVHDKTLNLIITIAIFCVSYEGFNKLRGIKMSGMVYTTPDKD